MLQSMKQPREERYAVDVPVRLADGAGVARNLSTSGIYFETDLALRTGASIRFTVQLDDSPAGPMRLQCEAEIVRVEEKDGRLGVGARILDMKFEHAQAAA
jgi:hypothetical protein